MSLDTTTQPTLYSYFRSSCSWRVRTALNLKEISYKTVPINLVKAEQLTEEYKEIQPMGMVPALVVGNDTLYQSVAILEYLDEVYPDVPLLPKDPVQRAQARGLYHIIATDTQPVQNLRILIALGDATKNEWARKYINIGFAAFEKMVSKSAGKYCVGDQITVADLALVPQVYNANRFEVDMTPYPTIRRLNETLSQVEAFASAHPSKQIDCPPELR